MATNYHIVIMGYLYLGIEGKTWGRLQHIEVRTCVVKVGGKRLCFACWRTVLENGENQKELIVYAALGKAARNWDSYHAIVNTLQTIEEDETLVIQSGKPIGIMKTHAFAPLVIMANCNVVGKWATSENFYDLQEKGLIIWGGLTAAAWQYIGSQGVIQGTYEIFAAIGAKHFNHSLAGKFILTAGLGGMGGAQPLAGVMVGAAILAVEIDEARVDKRIEEGYLQKKTHNLDEALSCD